MDKIVRIFARIRRLWRLSKEYDVNRSADTAWTRHKISAIDDRLGEHTTIHADIHHRNPHHIIVIGKYRNRDYVRMFELDEKDLTEMIEMLKRMEPNAKVGRFDMVGGFDFSVVYERDRL